MGTPIELPEDPSELAATVALRDDDVVADGYVFEESGASTELCLGVESITKAHPPIGRIDRAAFGDHLLYTGVFVYDTAQEAGNALDYLRGALPECSGQFKVDEIGAETIGYFELFKPPTIETASNQLGYESVLVTNENTTATEVEGATVSNMVLLVASSDTAATNTALQIMVARAAGFESDLTVAPVGSQEIGPGFRDPQYWWWPEGVDLLREETPDSPWLAAQDDETANAFAASTCAIGWTVGDSASLGAFDAGISSLTDGAPESESIGTTALRLYCPYVHDYVEDIRSELPGG